MNHSKQSIMHLTLGYSFLKQDGRVFLTCCRLGHTIKTDSSFDISLIQAIKILLTVVADTWNLNPKSIVKRASLSFILSQQKLLLQPKPPFRPRSSFRKTSCQLERRGRLRCFFRSLLSTPPILHRPCLFTQINKNWNLSGEGKPVYTLTSSSLVSCSNCIGTETE